MDGKERYSLGGIATIGKNRNHQDIKGSPATIRGHRDQTETTDGIKRRHQKASRDEEGDERSNA